MPKHKKSSKIGWFILLVVLAAVSIAAVILAPRVRSRWTAPLGPGLELPTYTPAVAEAVKATTEPAEVAQAASATPFIQEETASSDSPIPPSSTPLLPTATLEPLCGGPPAVTILGIGADNSDESYRYGLADAIRIARVDFVTPKITMLTVPRDLWVEIPGISSHYDITHGKLNQAYFYGGEGMGYYDGPGQGPGLLARTLDLNFNLRAEHYGAVNMAIFKKIVDALGGIDVYLETDMDGTPIDDRTEDMGYFYAGNNHLTGEEALRLVRIRKRYNDFKRQDTQTLVMCAIKEKLTDPRVVTKIPALISAFQGQVLTDLSLEQISQFACLLPHLKRENLIFTSLPDDIFTPSRVYSPQQRNTTFVLDADYDVIRDYAAQFMAGTWPTQPDEPSCP